jgi:transcriptional regulator with GAF, ATPase, and Fis domain
MKIWVEEEGRTRKHELPGRSATIGRDKRNAVVLESPAISAFHMELRVTETGLSVRDLGSRNGSALLPRGESKQRGIQPHQLLRLQPGDTLLLGAQGDPVRVRAQASDEAGGALLNETIHASRPVLDASVEQVDHQSWPLLVQLNQALLSAISLDELLERGLVSLLALIPHASYATVTLFADAAGAETGEIRRMVRLQRGPRARLEEIPRDRLAFGRLEQLMMQRLVQRRVGLLWTDPAGETSPASPHPSPTGRSVAAAPLWVGEDVLGLVQLCREPLIGTGLSEAHLDLLLPPAGALALAVRNAQHVEHINAVNDRLAQENHALRQDLRHHRDPREQSLLIGESPPMVRLKAQIEQVAPTPLPVLVTGETGTGKELVARLLHRESDRQGAPFVACNVASLPLTIVEAELFGVARGAFTGADADRAGLFEEADGGTLFLDEIGELPATTQATLLRVLQEQELRRVGETRTRKVDVRLVAATNRDLVGAVQKGDFRQDLLFRINTITLEVPPLRQRQDDIPLLVEHLLRQASARQGRSLPDISHDVLPLLTAYGWPGNVRQLANELARAVALTRSDEAIGVQAFSPDLRGLSSDSAVDGPLAQAIPLKEAVASFEREYVRSALLAQGGRKAVTAQLLGITRAGLHKIIRRHGIED